MRKFHVVVLSLVATVVIGLGVILHGSFRGTPAPVYLDRPGVIMEVLDPSLEMYAVGWQKEIARRVPNAVGVLCHGGDFEQGRWIVASDSKHIQTARDVVLKYKDMYPGRTIVLLSCNPGHIKLGVPGVLYAHSSVWCVPDRELKPSMSDAERMAKLFDHGFWTPKVPDESVPAPVKILPVRPVVGRSDAMPEIVGNIFEFEVE